MRKLTWTSGRFDPVTVSRLAIPGVAERRRELLRG
jgi:hypothetical protein